MAAENTSRFAFREARAGDLPVINAFAYSEGMDNMPGIEGITVAVDADDFPIGFVRVAHAPDGIAYINPIVVNPLWRGCDVGSSLMEIAEEGECEVRMVARGQSVGFYENIGYEPCDWSMIEKGFTEECDGCPMIDECRPLPMRKVLKD